MRRNDTFEKLEKIFKDVLGKNTNIALNTIPMELENWDSLNNLFLLTEIQKHFKITFSLKEIAEIKTIEDIVNLIEGKN